MTTNAFAISRRLVDRGVEKPVADAVAEEIVDYHDERVATKADIANVRAEIANVRTEITDVRTEIAELRAQNKLIIGLVVGQYIGIVLLYIDKIIG